MKLLTTITVILFSFISSFAQINSTSFASKVDFSVGTNTAVGLGAIADLNNDNKPEVLVPYNSNVNTGQIAIFNNTSVQGIINTSSFAPVITLPALSRVQQLDAADLDGDGKADIVSTSPAPTNIAASFSIYKNTSSGANITFSAPVNIGLTTSMTAIKLKDIDGDGKADIVGAMWFAQKLRVYRNTSTIGNISFDTLGFVEYNAGIETISLACADFNVDGKTDIAICNYSSNNIMVFNNASSIGNISFLNTPTTVTTGSLPGRIIAADMDNDNKVDLLVSTYGAGNIGVFKNTSTLNNITFSPITTFTSLTNPLQLGCADFDADGKQDVAVGYNSLTSVSVWRNFGATSSINSNTLGSRKEFTSGGVSSESYIADIDSDNKPDIVLVNRSNGMISILKNQTTPSNGLIAYYPFNGNAGDSSGFENHGTVTGAALTTDKENLGNRAYSFNGSNNKITISPTYLMPNTYTYSLWMNMNAAPTPGNIASLMGIGSATSADQFLLIGNAGSNGLGIGYGSYFAHLTTPDRYWTGSLPATNTWYHIALARSSDSLRFYINGILVDKRPTSATAAYGSSSFEAQIGCRVGSGQFFNGKIDEVRIYNRPLSLNEVRFLAGIDTGGTIYYSKSSGNLNSLSTWGTNADGSGTAPLSFDSSNATYRVVNNASPTLGGNLRIGGANSTLVFGDGTNAFNLVIGTNDTLSCDSMFVQNNITLTNSGTLVCTKLGAANNSTVQYIRSTPQMMAAGSYGNLVASSSTKTLTENTTIKGAFGMLASINCNGFNLTLGSSAASTGLLNRSSGTIIGRFTRWFNNTTNTGATGLFPVGTATKYTPYQMEFTSAPTTGGTITCEFITGNPGNIGLPQFDFTAGAVFIDKAAIDGVWRLSGSAVTGGTFNATVTANSFAGVNSYADLRLIRRAQAGSWTLQGNATVNAGSNAAAIVGRIGLSTIYGEYGIGGDQSVNPLPVKLVSFTASLINNDRALLQWQTAQEFNADYFIVQRSTDQINWVDRGNVNAKGFSNTLVKYALNDAIEQSFDIIYYRLMQVDVNGKKTGSKTVSVTPTKAPEFSVFPNPAQRNVYVQGLAGEAIIYNIAGLPVLTIVKDGWVNIEHLKAGIYFVKSAQKTIRLVVE